MNITYLIEILICLDVYDSSFTKNVSFFHDSTRFDFSRTFNFVPIYLHQSLYT